MRRAAAVAALLLAAACGGGSGTPGSSGGNPSRTFSEPDATPDPGETTGGETPEPGETETATDSATPSPAETTASTGPTGPPPTYDLSAQGPPECSLIPGGMADGRDALNVAFFIVLIGESSLSPVDASGVSDTGLTARLATSATNRGRTFLQFAPRSEDYGRTHRFELTVDPGNRYRETDEGNNTLVVNLTLPSPRPSRAIDPLACG